MAGFVGQVNLVEARLAGEEGGMALVETGGTRLRAPHPGEPAEDGAVTLALRPEMLHALPAGADAGGMNSLAGRVAARHFAGNLLKLQVTLGDGRELVVEGRPRDDLPPPGDEVQVAWRAEDAVVLTR